MPRTTTVATPGCPPLRALTFDALGLVKVIEAREEQDRGAAKLVEKWGDPDSSKSVLAFSTLDRESDPLVSIARKCGSIEVISAVSGDLRLHIPNVYEGSVNLEEDAVMGLHLFRKNQLESYSRSCTLLTCTKKGHVSLESYEFGQTPAECVRNPSPTVWNVCGSGNIICSKVDESENYALFGGKGVEANLWDLQKSVKTWSSKSPPKNSLGIFTPTWFTCATFLCKDDHRKFVTGTNSHQIRLYDTSAQRRPLLSIDFRETPITAVAEDEDGHKIYVGNGSGDLASIDMRTGKLLGCFIGKCSGSIKSIAKHCELPVIASCGLDSYLRIWDVHSRQLLSAVFLKQHLNGVAFDSHFRAEGGCAQVESAVEAAALPAAKRKHNYGSKEREKHKSRKMTSKRSGSKRFKGEEED